MPAGVVMAEITVRISDKMQKTVAAIVLVLSLAALGLSVWSSELLVPMYRLQMYAPESGGLAVGAEVRLNGMPVGKVGSISPAAVQTPNRKVQVVLRIQERYQDYIRSDSTASINSLGILGNHFVNIHGANGGNPLQPGGEITFEPTHEPTAKDLIDALGGLGKRNGCSDGEKREVKDSSSKH
jgi:phospholipid/cholesterol/gamma-HCH transport system substrate-binding protein